jgi:hypothetical protein
MLLVLSPASHGCSLLFVPRPARAASAPETACGAYFWPGSDMTAALLLGWTAISVLFAGTTPSGQSMDANTRLTGAAGVGALAGGFVASGLVGMNWIEGCRRLKAAQSAERPAATLQVHKRRLPADPEDSPVPRPAPPPETDFSSPSPPERETPPSDWTKP